MKNEHFSEILKGSAAVFCLRILAAVIALLLTKEITHQLGAEESGYYFFVISFITFLTSFASFGLINASLKEVALNLKNDFFLKNYITKSLMLIVVGVSIASLVLFLFNEISKLFGFEHQIISQYIIQIIMGLLPFVVLLFFSSYFQASAKLVRAMLLLNFMYQLVLLVLLTIRPVSNVESLLNYFHFSIYGILAIVLISFIRKSTFSTNDSKSFRSILLLSTPMMVGHIVSQVNNLSGQLLLSIFSTTTNISLIAVSTRVAILMSFLIIAVNKVVAPKFAILYSENKMDDLKKVVVFSNRLLLGFSLPILIGIILFGKRILNLFGEEFEDAYFVLVIVSIGQFFASISGTVVFLLQMTGHEKVVRNNIVFSTIATLIIGLVVVPIYGLIGAAIMTFVSLVSVNLMASYKAIKILNINPFKII
ncbi:polysaccharide biosynthesis C-terminal domain-containing protein [Fibrobacterales bacterium]|nr:polysaccharide biosynthesis C-terminal domain-containing protein [Fibrobacterales bacterium]